MGNFSLIGLLILVITIFIIIYIIKKVTKPKKKLIKENVSLREKVEKYENR